MRTLEVLKFENDVAPGHPHSLEAALAEIAKLRSENAQLKREKATDRMTGFYRKEFFNDKMDEMLALARKHGKPVAYLMIDGDGMKSINDTYGHDVGDEVIAYWAKVIGTSVRNYHSYPPEERRFGSLDGATDLVGKVMNEETVEIGRVGMGDEFGVALYGVDETQAAEVAQRMHDALRAHPYTTKDGKKIQLTMSIGIATTETETTRERMYSSADHALYAAKANGRNCSSIHRRAVAEAVPAPTHYQPTEVAA